MLGKNYVVNHEIVATEQMSEVRNTEALQRPNPNHKLLFSVFEI